MTKRITAAEYAREIYGYDNILILAHSHPDGDTVGTGMALLGALQSLGKNAVLACTDELPHHIAFMQKYADAEKCFFGRSFSENFTPEHTVSVDIASTGLVGNALSEYAKNIELALDHHNINTLDCPRIFIEPDTSSAGETMFFALRELEKLSKKSLIDKRCACALYAAISSDSGNFKFTSTTARTLHTAGELIELGADNGEIARYLFDIKTLDSFRAEALCTENVRFFHGGKTAFSYTDRSLYAQKKLSESDFDSCVQLLRMIEGVEVAVFAKEKTGDDGVVKYRLSLRSNEYADVAAICSAFGGGGHKKAAGCTVEGTLDEVIEKITSEIERAAYSAL